MTMQEKRAGPVAKYIPRREPKQRRSRLIVERILAAARQLLIEEGNEALTTNRIAETARVSVGSIYQYFPNKDAIVTVLVNEMFENAQNDLLKMIAASATCPSPRERARRVMSEVVRSLLTSADLLRALSPYLDELEEVGLVRGPQGIVTETLREFNTRLGAKLRHNGSNSALALALAVDATSHLLESYIIHGRPAIPPEQFANLTADLTTRFLYQDDEDNQPV